MTALRWGGATDQGQVRNNNQDAFLLADGINLFAVADGMGGHVGGEVAAQVAVEALEANMGPTTDSLVEAVQRANHAVYERAGEQPDLRGMGTTLCAIALVEDHGNEYLAVVNVGDSRVYVLQSGELTQVSDDHSLVEDLVRQNRLSREEARVHPQRNILTRALGNEPNVAVDSWEVVPYTGDRYLLCSDGVFNELDDDRIAATLRRLSDPAEAARELVRLANAEGGRDNITAVVVDVVDDGGRAEAASAALAAEGATSATPAATGSTPGDEEDDAGPVAAPVAKAARPGRRTTPAADVATSDSAADAAMSDDAGGGAPRPRRFTWRVGLFLVAVLAVVAAGVGFTAWYARSTYFVAIEDDTVAILRGRPDGVLWIDPTLERRTDLTADDVPAGRLDDLEAGKELPSLASAERYIDNLRDEAEEADQARRDARREARRTTSTTADTDAGTGTDTDTPASP